MPAKPEKHASVQGIKLIKFLYKTGLKKDDIQCIENGEVYNSKNQKQSIMLVVNPQKLGYSDKGDLYKERI